ncbi:MAG: hypothetical protein AVDCRST_MAG64-3986, partial [uncultured Phycisphaerae bacterium]
CPETPVHPTSRGSTRTRSAGRSRCSARPAASPRSGRWRRPTRPTGTPAPGSGTSRTPTPWSA